NVRAEQALAPRHRLRREALRLAVVDRAEGDAFVVGAEDRVPEGEDLEAAGVGQHRTLPAHEPVQAAEAGNELSPRAKVQVVAVAPHDRRAELAQLFGIDALDRRL